MRLVIRRAQPTDAVMLAEILTQAMRYKIAHDDMAWGSEPYTIKGAA